MTAVLRIFHSVFQIKFNFFNVKEAVTPSLLMFVCSFVKFSKLCLYCGYCPSCYLSHFILPSLPSPSFISISCKEKISGKSPRRVLWRQSDVTQGQPTHTHTHILMCCVLTLWHSQVQGKNNPKILCLCVFGIGKREEGHCPKKMVDHAIRERERTLA